MLDAYEQTMARLFKALRGYAEKVEAKRQFAAASETCAEAKGDERAAYHRGRENAFAEALRLLREALEG